MMGDSMTKAEKLARAMDQVMSGNRALNRQLAAQIRDELHRPAPAQDAEEVARLREALERARGYIKGGMYDRNGPVLRQIDAALSASPTTEDCQK